jgi:hypothetical protein
MKMNWKFKNLNGFGWRCDSNIYPCELTSESLLRIYKTFQKHHARYFNTEKRPRLAHLTHRFLFSLKHSTFVASTVLVVGTPLSSLITWHWYVRLSWSSSSKFRDATWIARFNSSPSMRPGMRDDAALHGHHLAKQSAYYQAGSWRERSSWYVQCLPLGWTFGGDLHAVDRDLVQHG